MSNNNRTIQIKIYSKSAFHQFIHSSEAGASTSTYTSSNMNHMITTPATARLHLYSRSFICTSNIILITLQYRYINPHRIYQNRSVISLGAPKVSLGSSESGRGGITISKISVRVATTIGPSRTKHHRLLNSSNSNDVYTDQGRLEAPSTVRFFHANQINMLRS
jgi:hypothetical protein